MAQRILDVGCGTGALGAAIKQRQPAEVVGITYSQAEAAKARSSIDRVIVQDLNAFDPSGLGLFDCLICSHVLEHLNWPGAFLKTAASLLRPDSTAVVALPNVLEWRQRTRFMLGSFRYTDIGLMDRTHFRFFDWQTAAELLTQSGYRVLSREAEGGFPLTRFVPGLGPLLNQAALRLAPGLFGWQFVITAARA